MTEIYNSNKKNYLDLVKRCFSFDEESMAYVEKRLSDEWEPVPELKALIGINGSHYEDQRITFDLDMSNPQIQSLFEGNDESYKMFKSSFRHALEELRDEYNCNIGYKEFIENKVVFKKNTTKIKKVFEVVYSEHNSCYECDAGRNFNKTECADWIVKKFERIGSCKKSAKKLQFVISFNPMDWLLSSTGEDWSSCFNIDNSGGGYQYCLGLPFLCGDKNRMLLYITDGTEKECAGIKSHHYQTRTWCILDESGTFNIVKWYPNDTVGVNPVNAITGCGNFKNKDYFRKGKYPIDVLSTEKGAVVGVYSDMGRLVEENGKLWLKGNGKDGQQLFTKNLIDLQNCGTRHSFHFSEMESLRSFGISRPGYRIPQWKKYGMHLDMFFPTLSCSCGSKKGGFMFRGETYLCMDCYKEKVYVCGRCGHEDYNDGEVHEVETSDGRKIKLCKSCWERRSDYICSCCGKYHTGQMYTTDDGKKICSTCLENSANGYSRCDSCGKVSKNIKYIYNTYSKTAERKCNDCSSDTRQEISTFGRYFGIETHRRPRGSQNNE